MQRKTLAAWRKVVAVWTCAVVSAVAALGAAPAHAQDDRLVLTGSSTVAPLAAEMAKRFEALNPGLRIDVQTGGSSRGIANARSGVADIGMVSRALTPEESDLIAHTVARDGIAVIVHADNPVTSLGDDEIVGIFTGKITDWRQVGGRPGRITVVNKAEGRSTLELFLSHFELDNAEIRPHVVIGDNQQGIKTVAGNPGAIGYVSIGAAEFEVRLGTPLKLLPMSGVPASTESVAAGGFPLSRPLNLVTVGAPQGLAAQFIEFAQSSDVHDLVEAEFFVALGQ